MSSQSAMQFVLGSEENKLIRIGEPFDEVQAHKRELDVCFPSGRLKRMVVVCLYETKQRLFWWNYSFINKNSSIDIANCLEKWSFHILDNKIVGFMLFTTQILYIEYSERYETLHEACRSLMLKLENQLEEIAKHYECIETPHLLQVIYLGRYIDRHFFYPPGQCIYPLRKPQVNVKITRLEDKWKIELEGVKKRKSSLILSNDYEVLEIWLDGIKKEIP